MGDQDANNFINITEADTTTFGMLHLTGDATVGGNAQAIIGNKPENSNQSGSSGYTGNWGGVNCIILHNINIGLTIN